MTFPPSIEDCVRISMAAEGSLAAETLQSIHAFLSGTGSSLAGQGLKAVTALLDTLESGLNGELEPAYYLSALDPGMGKTLSVSLFLKVWKERGYQPPSSVLIGVSRLEEIRTYVRTSGLAQPDFGVFTSDKAFNALGVPQDSLGAAPILFTTQQMIESRTRHRFFEAATDFHYQDAARTLCIWDESLIPGKPLSLRADELGRLASPLRYRHPKFVEAVEGLQETLKGARANDVLQVPECLETFAPVRPAADIAAVVKALKGMAGRRMLVVEGGGAGTALVGSGRWLPEDFAPTVILDASGRARTTYNLWEQHRGTLRRLPAAHNDYAKLTINLWQQASGKQSLENAAIRSRIANGIAEVINDAAEGEWLVVTYKDNPAIFEEVRSMVDERPSVRLHSLTWGQHHGTNEFADISNVVIVGRQHYGSIGFQALGAAASGLPADRLSSLEVSEVARGEFTHHLLQALCRSSVRRSSDGEAGRCQAYVVTTGYPQIEGDIRATFPKCRLWPWRNVEGPMSGKRGQLADYLLKAFGDPQVQSVRKVDVCKGIGVRAANLSALVRPPEFQDFMGRELIFSDGQRFLKHRVSFEPWPDGGWTCTEDE